MPEINNFPAKTGMVPFPARQNRVLKYFVLASAAFFFLCQKQVAMPRQAAEQYGKWFISPTPALTDSLLSYKSFGQKQDSLSLAAIRLYRGPSGAHTVVLTDSFGAAYTLGWKAPAVINRDTLYPLVVYLHGGTGSLLTSKGELAYDMLSPLADSLPLFLASPSANRYTPWWSPGGMSRILQTVRFMSLSYPIDPDRIYLAGVSDGATGCYLAANTISAPFAGFISVSGYGGMLFSFGLKLFPGNLMQRPILNINAGKDRIYPISQVMQFISWLEQNGVAVEHREYPDEEHGFDYRPKEFGNLVKIIRTWRRPEKPGSVSWAFTPGFPNIPPNCLGWELGPGAVDAAVTAFWDRDTLRVRSTGLASVTFSMHPSKSKYYYVAVNGSSAHVVRPEVSDSRMMLDFSLLKLSPRVKRQEIIRVKIAR